MKPRIKKLVDGSLFEVITLDELNDVAGLMDREERKYAVPLVKIPDILRALAPHFRVLEHVGKRVFRYESLYFDDNYATYEAHHKGVRRRFKVRTRLYADSGICSFEMKVKRFRGSTDKRRIKYSIHERQVVNKKAYSFVRKFYKDAYGKKFAYKLKPELNVINDRVTLVAKKGGERITLDFDMVFRNHTAEHAVSEQFVIVETKTPNGFGQCDRILRTQRVRPQRWCSKYCLGVAVLNLSHHNNTFKPVLRLMKMNGGGKTTYFNAAVSSSA